MSTEMSCKYLRTSPLADDMNSGRFPFGGEGQRTTSAKLRSGEELEKRRFVPGLNQNLIFRLCGRLKQPKGQNYGTAMIQECSQPMHSKPPPS
jgi:hypothetical protein